MLKKCAFFECHTENKRIECFALSCVVQIQILVFSDKCRQFWKSPNGYNTEWNIFHMKRAASVFFPLSDTLLSKYSKIRMEKKGIYIFIFIGSLPFFRLKYPYQTKNLADWNQLNEMELEQKKNMHIKSISLLYQARSFTCIFFIFNLDFFLQNALLWMYVENEYIHDSKQVLIGKKISQLHFPVWNAEKYINTVLQQENRYCLKVILTSHNALIFLLE